MSHREKLPPNYAKLEVALRSIGYSVEAAVADIVDNSLDASARSVLIRLIIKRGQPLDLVVWDDGRGMSGATLAAWQRARYLLTCAGGSSPAIASNAVRNTMGVIAELSPVSS